MIPEPAPAVPPQAAAAPRPREYGLDWLRVIAFAILIAYHAGMYFVPWPWLVKNPRQSPGLVGVMTFFSLWRLPLLFFISGAGTWFNLQRRGARAFAEERWTRLGVPLLFGTLVVVPPQIYVERVLAGAHYASYLDFWRTVFRLVPYPAGNLTWVHLWFLPYVLVYSLLLLPVFAWLRGARGRSLVDGLARWCDGPGRIYLLNLPLAAVAAVLVPRFPRTYDLVSDWGTHAPSALTFLCGFLVCGSPRFLEVIERRRRESAAVAGSLAVLVYAIRLAPLPAPAERWRGVATAFLDSYFAMAMIVALVGLARARLSRDSAALRWANAAVFPFYVVHQTITVLLGWAWRGWDLPVALKLPMLAGGTFLGSWVIYEAVRRTRITRVLFGMRP